MAAQAETPVKIFHSPNYHVAFNHNRGFQTELSWHDDLTMQAFAGFERLTGDAIEAFAAEIFGGAFD